MTRRERGFTLVELLVVIAIIGVLVALLLPAVQAAREAARRMSCGNNMKQHGIALHGYHDIHHVFPHARGGTNDPGDNNSNRSRASGWVALLPFMEQQGMHDQIKSGRSTTGQVYDPYGPVPWQGGFTPWRTVMDVMVCPSSSGQTTDNIGDTNYVFCVGDGMFGNNGANLTRQRGIFMTNRTFGFKDMVDGSSNTIALSECGLQNGRDVRTFVARRTLDPNNLQSCLDTVDPQNPKQYRAGVNIQPWRGRRWCDGIPSMTGFNTILPPNSPSCSSNTSNWDGVWGLYSAGSFHKNGVQVVLGDASVHFVSEQIDAGNPLAGIDPGRTPGLRSPFGVWGAMGSRNGGEADQLP